MKQIILEPGILLLLAGVTLGGLIFTASRRPWLIVLQSFLFSLLVAYLTPFTADLIAQPILNHARILENEPPESDCLLTYPLVGVLGGGLASPRLPTTAAQERLLKAASLLQKLSKKKIFPAVILSGGPTIPGDNATEAGAALVYMRGLLAADFEKFKFFTEGQSFNTHDNATRSFQLAKAQNLGAKIILVTSSIHLPRSAATFKSAGFEVCPLGALSVDLPPLVSFENATYLKMVFHEWLGFWMYRLRGWA